ncbi:hypothetical protein Rctr85_030 [Virus Rctr85]|nr:hypothetical protein Rctr85_030 [Virus Rctr85]
MTHPDVREKDFRTPGGLDIFWNDELSESYGHGDLIDTADKPYGRRKKGRRPHQTLDSTLPRFEESARQKYGDGKKPTLLLDFRKVSDDKFAADGDGVLFVVQKIGNSWLANAYRARWESPKFSGGNPAVALARLCAWRGWFLHRHSMSWWSLDYLFHRVHFKFPFKTPKRRPKSFVTSLQRRNSGGMYAWEAKS